MRVGRTWKEDGEDEESEDSVPTGWRRPTYWYVDSDNSQCGMQSWVGSHRRYAWIDLAAGPSRYGPRTAGDGGVAPGSIPRCTSSSAGPDSSNPVPVVKRGGFASRLATTVWRTVQHLFLPSLARLPNMLRLENGKANYHRQIIINIKEIVGVAGSLDGGIGSSENNCWADVARSLESLGLGNHQRVKVRHERISVQQCRGVHVSTLPVTSFHDARAGACDRSAIPLAPNVLRGFS